MKTRYAAALLVVIVVVAGCAGSATTGIETTTDDAVETTDGVETTTDEETADLPPGVTESGIENASRLLDANRRALAETGYGFRLVWNDAEESSTATTETE